MIYVLLTWHWAHLFATKPNELSSMPVMEERAKSHTMCSDLHLHILAHAHTVNNKHNMISLAGSTHFLTFNLV